MYFLCANMNGLLQNCNCNSIFIWFVDDQKSVVIIIQRKNLY